ncbi:MAG: hypothetical protein ABI988_18005 [Nitrospirota bacterium]
MNLDQYLMMDYIRRFGTGDYLRAGMATAESVTRVARGIAESSQIKARAIQLRAQIFLFRTSERFQVCVDDIVHSRPAASSNSHPAVSTR